MSELVNEDCKTWVYRLQDACKYDRKTYGGTKETIIGGYGRVDSPTLLSLFQLVSVKHHPLGLQQIPLPSPLNFLVPICSQPNGAILPDTDHK